MNTPEIDDYSPAAIARRQKKAARVVGAVLGVAEARVLLDGLPPALCQRKVADFRRHFRQDFLKQQQSLVADPTVTSWMLTVISADWVTGEGSLTPSLLREIREWAFTRLLKAKKVRLFSGTIDFDWSIGDGKEDPRFWQPHVHAIIAVSGLAEQKALKYVRKMFRTPNSLPVRIYRAVMVQKITALHGAIEYCSKSLLIDGPLRRSSWINAESGKRVTSKASLQRKKLIEIARLMMTSSLVDRAIQYSALTEPSTSKRPSD